MRIAYADPPYIGQAKRYTKLDNPEASEVDHAGLVESLLAYDGWALSCTSSSLRTILPMCPNNARVMAWVKTFGRSFPSSATMFAWEPVVVIPARPTKRWHNALTPAYDWVLSAPDMTTTMGAKPAAFCFWLFGVLGADPDDTFCDLFPGTGAVTTAWNAWSRQQPIRWEAP